MPTSDNFAVSVGVCLAMVLAFYLVSLGQLELSEIYANIYNPLYTRGLGVAVSDLTAAVIVLLLGHHLLSDYRHP